jgi:hypothetical protein
MTSTLTPFLELFRLAEAAGYTPSLHPRGPDGRFTHSFARLMTDDQRGHARRAAAAFKPKAGINTPDGARTYLGGLGKPSPATATYFSGGHAEVNQALRAGNDNYPGIKAMDAAMQPLPDDIIVTRRVPARSLGDATPEQLLNFRVADAGYTAGSVATMDSGPDDVLMHIAVPKGTKAAINPENGSIVLDRGLEMSILHVAPNERGGKDMFLIATPHDDGDGSGGLPNGPDGGTGDSGSSGGGPSAPAGDVTGGGRDRGGDGNAPAADQTQGAPPAGREPAPAGGADSSTAAADRTDGNAPPSADTGGTQTQDQPGAGDGGQGAGSTKPTADTAGILKTASTNATEDPTSFADADPALRDAMHQAFDFQSGGLTASLDDRVSNIYRDGDGRTVIRAEGYIRNDQGRIVGSYRRMMYPDTGEVHNDTLALSGGEQGSGFAQQFATRSEPQLAEMGLTHATVSATGVGGYAWRRYGWDPDSVNARGDVPDRLRSVAGQYDLSTEDRATLDGWLTAFQQSDQSKWPTPSEIGDFGKGKYDRKDDAGRTIWPGKDALVGASWQGRRDLKTGQQAAAEPA